MTEHVHELWINLNHPCYGIDVWHSCEDEKLARGQGYVPLSEIRASLNATERLSAEDAKIMLEQMDNLSWYMVEGLDVSMDAVQAYANILEGK